MCPRKNALIEFRPLQPSDKEPLHRILLATEVFIPQEITIALELLDHVIAHPDQHDYFMRVAEEEGVVVGYYCTGQRPMTDGTYDLYWIAVDPAMHSRGAGSQLLRHAEDHVRSRGGHLLMAETSSKPGYDRTHRFYERNAYQVLTRIKDFYRSGDDLIVYGKYFSQHEGS
jgi:ribosomal protein S18 acetylase RimI-like enzyme